jgi:hypothetical protein
MELFQKAEIFCLDSGGRVGTAASHAHTGPKVVLTTFEALRSKNLKQIDSESACSEDSASLFEIKNRRPTGKVIAKNVKSEK